MILPREKKSTCSAPATRRGEPRRKVVPPSLKPVSERTKRTTQQLSAQPCTVRSPPRPRSAKCRPKSTCHPLPARPFESHVCATAASGSPGSLGSPKGSPEGSRRSGSLSGKYTWYCSKGICAKRGHHCTVLVAFDITSSYTPPPPLLTSQLSFPAIASSAQDNFVESKGFHFSLGSGKSETEISGKRDGYVSGLSRTSPRAHFQTREFAARMK